MKFSKTLILVIGMIALIGVGYGKDGPPKNASPFVTVNIVKHVLPVAPVSNVVVTAIVIKDDASPKNFLQEKRPCYYSTDLNPDNSSQVILKERFYERDVSPGSINTDVIPRCRSSDMI